MKILDKSMYLGRRVKFIHPSEHENETGKVVGHEVLPNTKALVLYIEKSNSEVVASLIEYISFLQAGQGEQSSGTIQYSADIRNNMYK